jgi:hypothetical protein
MIGFLAGLIERHAARQREPRRLAGRDLPGEEAGQARIRKRVGKASHGLRLTAKSLLDDYNGEAGVFG